MKVLLFGATGMVGQGVLGECIADERVTQITAIVRTSTGVPHPKLNEVLHSDFFDYSDLHETFAAHDACLFCLGVSSNGMSEEKYTRLTYDLAVAAGEAMVAANPAMTMCFISGAGSDSSEQGRQMWARVKGRAENAILKMGFANAYVFRPGMIKPGPGITSRFASYRFAFFVLTPVWPLLLGLRKWVTSTEKLGRAMISVALQGYSQPILESRDINAVAEGRELTG